MSKEIISKEEFTNETIRLFKKYGIVNKNIWNQYSIYKEHTFEWLCHKNGGLKKILKENGINYIYYNESTKAELLSKAKELYSKHGYIDKELCCKNHISSSPVRKIFGGYNNMFKEMGVPLNMPRGITKEELMVDILHFIEKYNSTSSTLYRKYGKYSENTINKYGGWEFLLDEMNIKRISNSQPEMFIESILIERKMNFKKHFNFEWLRTDKNRKMFVDFYLIDYNVVIEYDGGQHYNFVPYFHKSIDRFNNSKNRDVLKEKLLIEHGIKVFRIIYSDDILSKLNEILNSLN